MSLLAGLTKDVAVTETDSVGFTRIPSGVYPYKIKMAFLDANAKGSISVKLELEVIEDASAMPPKRRTIFHNQNITYTGGAFTKDNKPFFGLGVMNGLAQLNCGKDLLDLERENKTIEVFEDGGKKMREKEVIVELIGTTGQIGLIDAIVDKQAKNNQTGKWEATGETRQVTECDKYFDFDSLQTSSEKAANQPAKFVETWKEKYVTGEVFNKAKGVAASGATQGAPAQAGGAQSTAGSLFN